MVHCSFAGLIAAPGTPSIIVVNRVRGIFNLCLIIDYCWGWERKRLSRLRSLCRFYLKALSWWSVGFWGAVISIVTKQPMLVKENAKINVYTLPQLQLRLLAKEAWYNLQISKEIVLKLFWLGHLVH